MIIFYPHEVIIDEWRRVRSHFVLETLNIVFFFFFFFFFFLNFISQLLLFKTSTSGKEERKW